LSEASARPNGEAAADPAVSAVSGGRRLLTAREKLAIGAVVLAACGVVALWPADRRGPAPEPQQTITEGGRNVPYRPMPVPEPPAEAVARVTMPVVTPAMPMPGSGAGAARPTPSPILAYEDRAAPPVPAAGPQGTRAAGPAGEGVRATSDDSLAARLRPSRLQPARAAVLHHAELTIPMGARIPCLPEMPIDSAVAGFFSCIVPVDVRGATGTVVLMERGTRIVGEVRAALARGARRLFVVMTSALTPNGVEIGLDSPGADVVGQAGLDGAVDTHFFERFRGAMLLAFLDTGLQAAALVASNAVARERGGISFFQFQGGGRQAANTALEADINIPSTLHRNQAEPMTVFVARNLSFEDVYRLRVVR
jgi:type IV secretion system protein VirB10